MIVYVLRHGRAVPVGAPGVERDEQRYLSPHGRRVLEVHLHGLVAELTPPAVITHSGYVRARETAEVLATVIAYEQPLRVDARLAPCTDPEPIAGTLREAHQAGTHAVALVSHEPTCGALIGLLVHGSARAAVPLNPGMIAAVELATADPWRGTLLFTR